MQDTPKSLRLQIALTGRTNAGKSSVLNYIASQEVSIGSALPGTTTDTVEKAMELLPLGPVLFLDSAGMNDQTALGERRMECARKLFRRCGHRVLVVSEPLWGEPEEQFSPCAGAQKSGDCGCQQD